MKKSLLLLSIVLLAFAACNKEPEPVVVNNEDIVLTFTSAKPDLEIEDEAGTRTAWDNTTSSVVWSANDKIRVGFKLNGSWWSQSAAADPTADPATYPKFYASDAVSIDDTDHSVGTFSVPVTASSFTDPATTGTYQFFAVYPSSLISNATVNDPTAQTITVKQTQSPGSNTFDAAADILLGQSEEMGISAIPTDPIELMWKRVVSHAVLTFSNMAFSGAESVSKITLTFNDDAKVTGTVSANIEEGTIGTGSSNVLTLDNGFTVSGSSIAVWACVLPVTFTSLDVEVKTDKATYTRSITGISKTFKKNARNTLTVNMSTAVREAVTQYDWVLTDLASITSSDVFVIVGNNGSTYAMSNDKGTGAAPDAVAVSVANNKLSVAPAEKIQWNLSKDGGNYTFYPKDSTTIWLYCTNTNNGVRVGGTNDNKVFTLDASGYLKNTATSRYLGIYNSQDWRCYNSSTATNIKDQSFSFYVRTASGTPATYAVNWTDPTETGCSITATVNSSAISSGDKFAAGTVVTITATAGTDYEFGGWSITGATAANASAASTTFTIGESAVSFSATFNSTVVSATALPYEETFASDKGDFIIDNVALDGLTYVWSHDSSNKYMKASGYASSANHDVESWLISPLLEIPTLSTGETIKLKFTQCINKYFGTVSDEATLMVKEESGSWTNVAITYPTLSGNWSSFEQQIVDLSSYAGKNIQFAFKYVGTSTASGTWEIKDVSVKKYEPKALSSISVSGQTTIFTQGDAFSFGGTVTATYNDETTADVTVYSTFTGYDMSSPGDQTVTVSYTESGVTKTTTYTITVNAAGTEAIVYTLDGTTAGTGNSYAGNNTTTQSGISWTINGNLTTNPWRIGGKDLDGVDRLVYSTTALAKNISKIEITHGAASNITVNSMTVIVSKNADFSSPVSTLTPTFVANGTVTINRPDGKDWSSCYYKIVYNVTVSDTKNNRFIQFTKVEFTGK